jgi:hypothetical protein
MGALRPWRGFRASLPGRRRGGRPARTSIVVRARVPTSSSSSSCSAGSAARWPLLPCRRGGGATGREPSSPPLAVCVGCAGGLPRGGGDGCAPCKTARAADVSVPAATPRRRATFVLAGPRRRRPTQRPPRTRPRSSGGGTRAPRTGQRNAPRAPPLPVPTGGPYGSDVASPPRADEVCACRS